MNRTVLKILLLTLVVAAASIVSAQEPSPANNQGRVLGVVTAIDAGANQITIRTDAGELITIAPGVNSAVLRLPAGETSAQKATPIKLGEIAVGERVFARGTLAANGKSIDARQVVVTSATAAATVSDQQRQREDFRQRGLMGRITSLKPTANQIIVQSRTRDGMGEVAVNVSDKTRFFRYAADSMNINDASRSSYSQLRVGDQLRALGARSEDGTQFSAEEIISGSMTRTAGQVVSVNAAKNELVLKDAQGQNITVNFGPRSTLRRVTPEAAAAMEANRPGGQGGQRRQRDQSGEARERRDGEARERRDTGGRGEGGSGRRRGGGFQNMFENLPAITLAELKKGDVVFVSASEGASPSHVTAITLVTGDATFMSRFMQNGRNRGPQNPGLPGDVIGGGVGPAERPNNP